MEPHDVVGELIKFFNPREKPSDAWMMQTVKELRRYDMKALDDGYGIICRTQRMFPALDAIIQACNQAQESINAAKLAAYGARERRAAEALFAGNLGSDDFGRRAGKNIAGLLKGTITRGEFVQEAEALGINCRGLKSYYLDNDLPLDKPAGSQRRERRVT